MQTLELKPPNLANVNVNVKNSAAYLLQGVFSVSSAAYCRLDTAYVDDFI